MSLSDEEKRIIYDSYGPFGKILRARASKYGAVLTDAVLLAAKEAAYKHHIEHLDIMSIQQNHVDPYKIAAWYGFFLNKLANDKNFAPAYDPNGACLLAAIGVMNKQLRADIAGAFLDRGWLQLLYRYVRNDGGKDDHGVGKNGLYVAFATARRALANKWGVRPDLTPI